MRATSGTGERGRGDAGFTLLEMLVVVGVLGLASGIAFPAVRPALTRIAVQSARADLAANLRSARDQAIRLDREVTVDLAPTPQGYAWNGRRVALPGGARLLADTASVRFSPDGAASGGRFAIAWKGRALGLALDGETGVVTLERPD